jgi:hypothetical protein
MRTRGFQTLSSRRPETGAILGERSYSFQGRMPVRLRNSCAIESALNQPSAGSTCYEQLQGQGSGLAKNVYLELLHHRNEQAGRLHGRGWDRPVVVVWSTRSAQMRATVHARRRPASADHQKRVMTTHQTRRETRLIQSRRRKQETHAVVRASF